MFVDGNWADRLTRNDPERLTASMRSAAGVSGGTLGLAGPGGVMAVPVTLFPAVGASDWDV